MIESNEGLPLQLEPEEHEQAEEQVEVPRLSDDVVVQDSSAKKMKLAAEAAKELSIEIPAAKHSGAPMWVTLPHDFKFPRGKQVLFMRFKSAWTDTPWKGEPMLTAEGTVEVDSNGRPVLYRQCICWPINSADKKVALGRAQRDPNRAADELAKQMIRVHDGQIADWTVVRTNGVEMFWNELGEKCRGLLQRVFAQLHVLDVDSTRDFLQNCIEVRSTGS
jgi:hypothetical protein